MQLPTNDDYSQLSQAGDPLADAVVLALQARGRGPGDLLQQVKALAQTEGGPYRAFLDQVNTVPEWLRPESMALGQEVFLRCVPLSIIVFVLGSLLVTYTPPGAARVLLHTGRLHQDVVRRLYETATMVKAVTQPGGMEVGAPGHQAIVRVRLLHAMVRQHVRTRPGWPAQTLGGPINQLQLGLTALTFSVLLLGYLRKLGVVISDKEAQAYQHLWRYGNYLQGVDSRLLPATLQDEAELYGFYEQTLMQPDDNSRTLVAAVHEGLAGRPPFYLPPAAMRAISRRLLGEAWAERLGIPRHRGWGAALAVAAAAYRLSAVRLWVPGWRALEVRLGRAYFQRVVDKGLAGHAADYAMKITHDA